MGRQCYSTSTLTGDGRTVPWLAASGPLSYSPEAPPQRDYFFQYTWIIPGILDPEVNRRRHYYFGARYREYAQDAFGFWEAARQQAVTSVLCRLGTSAEECVTAPIAAYVFERRVFGPIYALIQHGSYLFVPIDEQPEIDKGLVLLHRGIGKASTYRHHVPSAEGIKGRKGEIWRRYMRVQAAALSDSVVSFNTVHDRAKRCETDHINDRTWAFDDLARDSGLDIERHRWTKQLWRAATQSFSLVRNVGSVKFGPNFVTCRTPIDNIRLTTFFAGEYEVRVIDPGKLELVQADGCTVARNGSRRTPPKASAGPSPYRGTR